MPTKVCSRSHRLHFANEVCCIQQILCTFVSVSPFSSFRLRNMGALLLGFHSL